MSHQTNIDILCWMKERMASEMDIDISVIDMHVPFHNYGLDSAKAMLLSGELSDMLGRNITPTVFWDYPTMAELASALESEGERHVGAGGKPSAETAAPDREPIAIVGIGCRFPGAEGPAAFWKLLMEGQHALGPYPLGREAQSKGQSTREGGYLAAVDGFDYPFFKLSYREAVRMDPQQRMLLEVVWEAFEDAGIPPENWAGTASGVFIGISNSDYGREELHEENPHIYSVTGGAHCIAANRLSYQYDLRGPSVAIDTACSSSLVAVNMACQSIWLGESRQAIAGGVNVILSHHITDSLANAGMLAADDRCKTFDSRADGYVRGEGCGVIVLKTLAQAVADGNDIYAVIRGGCINQDGRSNGITAPNQKAQEQLLKTAYAQAGIEPQQVAYVEAHGTGTFLGDPIEVKALGQVMSGKPGADEPIFIGSVKTNIGHLESAAGIAGLIKTALLLKHRIVPPHLHFQNWNPEIPYEDLPFRVPTAPQPLAVEGSCFAGVSSFGFGGTNAHVVLETPPSAAKESTEDKAEGARLFVWSAKQKEGLDQLMKQFADSANLDTVPLERLSAGLLHGRAHHNYRCAVVAHSLTEARSALSEASGSMMYGYTQAAEGKLSYYFPGRLPEKDFQWPSSFQDAAYLQAFEVSQQLGRRMAGDTASPDTEQALRLFYWQYAMSHLLSDWGVTALQHDGDGVGWVSAAVAGKECSLVEGILTICEGSFSAPLENEQPVRAAAGTRLLFAPLGRGAEGRQSERDIIASICHTRADLLNLLGRLYVNGIGIAKPCQQSVSMHMLPTYPWLHRTCWREEPSTGDSKFACFC